MKASFRQSMAWLHTWSGLVIGWLLLSIFATGLASYFKDDIHAWMRPEIRAEADPIRAVARGVDWVVARYPGAAYLYVAAPDAHNPAAESYWETADGAFVFGMLDPATGALFDARETLGGEFFYRFHFELMLPYPWGRYLAAAAAMAMLLAVVTGIVTHKRIFKDLFTFRPGKGQRSWLDIHNVLGVLSLPFHLMIAYTGLVTLMTLFMPWAITANYPDESAYYADFPSAGTEPPPSGRPAPLTPVEPVLREAASHWGGEIGAVRVSAPGDGAARISIERDRGAEIGYRPEIRVYDGVTGAYLSGSAEPGPALATEEVLYGLHMGRFAQPVLRALYFLSGLGGFAMIATGLVLWVVKRRPLPGKDGAVPPGHAFVERMNVAAIAGVPFAMAAYLAGNRLLPLGLEGRADEEANVYLYALAGMVVVAQILPRRFVWPGLAGLTAAAFLAVPMLNAATTDRGLDRSLAEGDLQMILFDLTLLAVGTAYAAIAVRAAYRPAPKLRPHKTARAAA